MGCFDSLVKSHFIANASVELKLARQTVKLSSQPAFTAAFLFNKAERQAEYDNFVYQWYILEEIESSLLAEGKLEDVSRVVFYMKLEEVTFIYSLSKVELKKVENYSFEVNGDIPLCRSKHKIKKGVTVHTMILDNRLQFIPYTAN